ncbi:MAG: hypothetical protein AB7G21_03765 [Dehalococcoidia bacterium]
MVLEIEEPVLQGAILSDYLSVSAALSVRLPRPAHVVRDEIPTRVPQAIPRRSFA